MQRNNQDFGDQSGITSQLAKLIQQLTGGGQQAPQQPLGMLQSQDAPIAPGAQGNAPNAPQASWLSPDMMAGVQTFGGLMGDIQAGPGTNIGQSITQHYNEARQMQDQSKQREGNQKFQDFLGQTPNAQPEQIYRAMLQSGNPDLQMKGAAGLASIQKSKQSGAAGYAPTSFEKDMLSAGIPRGSEEWNERMIQHLDGNPRGVGAQSLNAMRNSIKKEHPEWGKDTVDNAFNAYLNYEDTFPNGDKLPPLSGQTKSYMNLALKSQDTAAGLNSSRSAHMFDSIWKDGSKLMPNVVKYSGALGAGKRRLDQLNAGMGSSTPEYRDYIKFTRVTAPALANAAIKAEGANMTNESKNMMLQSVSPNAWDTDPEAAMASYEYLGKLYGGSISPAVSSSIADVKSSIKRGEREYNKDQSQQASSMVTVTNKRTGETKSVSLEEARRLGVPNV